MPAELVHHDLGHPRADPREVAAENENFGVEDVRQDRRADAEPLPDLAQRAQRVVLAALRAPDDLSDRLGRIDREVPCRIHAPKERAKSDVCLPAADPPAAARWTGLVEDHVSDLAAEPQGATLELAVDDHRAADTELPGDVDHLV